MAGHLGNIFLLFGLLATVLSGLFYFHASRSGSTPDWLKAGRWAWMASTAAVIGASAVLAFLMANHRFEYAYVYQNSSLDLPGYYLISSFWAGQEGSFLLWIVYTGIVGVLLTRWARNWEAPVMAIVALCQMFLISMIVGLDLGIVKIGSSPFMSLADKFPDAPMLRAGLMPSDGSGLNDLLQNPWMVIHPPTLFVGFATMVVPFAFACAGLWKKDYRGWIRPALPWMVLAVMVLGTGIAMGGYWAYVTLSFGGYWAWDPVENSSLVPWMIGVAALHTMISYRKSGHGARTAVLLTVFSFVLVVYSTFLTRSGILGDISVHSFVDLGLYNQLLLWIVTMTSMGIGLVVLRYRELPAPRRQASLMSREFFIFTGAVLLCITAVVILIGTSAPILGRLFRDSPSAVPLSFYNRWSLPLTVGFMFFAGLGQLIWWNKIRPETLRQIVVRPMILSVVSTAAVLLFSPFVERLAPVQGPNESVTEAVRADLFSSISQVWGGHGSALLMLLLVFVSFFALFGNGMVLIRVARGNPRLAGGALAHVGFALVILGIVASSGFSRPIAMSPEAPGRENVVVPAGQTVQVNGYHITYRGTIPGDRGRPKYDLHFETPDGDAFAVTPVVYKSSRDQWIQHPDLKIGLARDLFVAVTPREMTTAGETSPNEVYLARGESRRIAGTDLVLRFDGFNLDAESHIPETDLEIVVGANISVSGESIGTKTATPLYVVRTDRMAFSPPVAVEGTDLRVSFTGMNVDDGTVRIVVEGGSFEIQDFVIVQAYEKPLIGVLWLGIIVVIAGFGLALFRRATDWSAGVRVEDDD